MRDQSYNNAPNMKKGQYKGLQRRIKETSPPTKCTFCISHWMNSIGTHSVKYCHETIKPLLWVKSCIICLSNQHIGTKFCRDLLISDNIAEVLIKLQWVVRADATPFPQKHWREITQALVLIGNDVDEILFTRNTANGLRCNLEQSQTSFFECLFGFTQPV